MFQRVKLKLSASFSIRLFTGVPDQCVAGSGLSELYEEQMGEHQDLRFPIERRAGSREIQDMRYEI
jgi:hypothetical protein